MSVRPQVYLIGVGALGIRHLEGLMRSRTQLTISVVDPSAAALRAAKCVPVPSRHRIEFVQTMTSLQQVDVAIVATTSRHRAAAVRELLRKAKIVRCIVLEKILFDRKSNYVTIEKLLIRHGVKVWVNSPVRTFPFHQKLKEKLGNGAVFCHFSGGERYGLMTTAIHDAHYASYLVGSRAFTTDTSLLRPTLVDAKRRSYKELHGTLEFCFANGSRALSTTLPFSAPRRIAIMGKNARATIEQPGNVAWIAEKKTNWKWKQMKAPFLLQSDMTGPLIERILKTGTCDLPTFKESARIHLQLLEPVQKFLHKHGYRSNRYPFT